MRGLGRSIRDTGPGGGVRLLLALSSVGGAGSDTFVLGICKQSVLLLLITR